jgi:hypothetical protein
MYETTRIDQPSPKRVFTFADHHERTREPLSRLAGVPRRPNEGRGQVLGRAACELWSCTFTCEFRSDSGLLDTCEAAVRLALTAISNRECSALSGYQSSSQVYEASVAKTCPTATETFGKLRGDQSRVCVGLPFWRVPETHLAMTASFLGSLSRFSSGHVHSSLHHLKIAQESARGKQQQ